MSRSKASGPSRYEMLLIAPNNYTEDEAKQIIAKIEKSLEEQGASIVYREFWGKKKLAYPIKHNHYGYYNLCEFDAERNIIAKIDRELRLSKEVLRHQIISVPALSDEERQQVKDRQEKSAQKDKKDVKPVREKNIKIEKKEKKEENKENKEEGKADLKDLDQKLEGILNAEDLV